VSEEIWTIIKYKPKVGCEDEFVEGLKRLEQMIEKSKAGQEFQNKFIKIDSGEYVQIVGLPNLESLLDGQIEGLDWLDSVDHLLDYYEDDSRTEAFSGFVIDLNRP
tara:strand:- start:35 stop:352 length:318 start_codon:yes stop_codon:yes gene_type:complete